MPQRSKTVAKEDLGDYERHLYDLCHRFLSSVFMACEAAVLEEGLRLSKADKQIQKKIKSLCSSWQSAQATDDHGGEIVYMADSYAEFCLKKGLNAQTAALCPEGLRDEMAITTLEKSGAVNLAEFCRRAHATEQGFKLN